jgi:hypothetical protein
VLPKTLDELHDNMKLYDTKTKLGEQFLLVNDDEENILMFSTQRNLKFLVTCDYLLMDGTFYSSPSLFTQLFVVHGKKVNSHVPLAYFLLTGKKTFQYERAIRKLKSFLPASYTPRITYVDFECSIHRALRKVWPSTSIQGCRFHLGQAWFRKIQSLGLTKLYRSRSAEGSFLRSFFGLSFIKPEDMEDFFVEDFLAFAPTPTHPKIREFSEYVFDTYISSMARFPPSMWSRYSKDIGRTTNACESFSSRLNAMFYHSHPNIFLLVDALLEIQEEAVTKMLSVGNKRPYKSSTVKEAFIQCVMNELESGEIDTREYVKKLSRKFIHK